MLKMISMAVTAMILCGTVSAKPFYKQKKFWLGEAVIAAVIAADVKTSADGPGCPYQTETNPILGKCPTVSAYARFGLLDFGLEGTVHAVLFKLEHDDTNKFMRVASYTFWPAFSAGLHIDDAVNNHNSNVQTSAAARAGLIQ